MAIPRTDDERNFTETLINVAMNDRAVLTDSSKALDNAFKGYMRETESMGLPSYRDFRDYKEYVISEVMERRGKTYSPKGRVKEPNMDWEREWVEGLILLAMNDRAVLKDPSRAVDNAFQQDRKDKIRLFMDDYKAFKKYMIDEINKRRAPVPERDIQDFLPHGGLPLGDPRYKGDRMATDNELRNKLIRLAHSNPELREQILPLVREASIDPVKAIEDLLAFYKDYQALINDRKHRDFMRTHAKMLGKVLNDLNKELGEIDGYYQLGYTPMTRRSSDKKD